MSTQGIGTATPPTWFRVVAGVALLWNVLGVVAFIGQQTMDPATLPPAERSFYEATPAWATAAFAVAVFAGVLGCIGLLLRKSWAVTVFLVSLLGIVVQIGHSLFIGNGIEVFGAAGFILPGLTLAIGVALLWLARLAMARGWLQAGSTAG